MNEQNKYSGLVVCADCGKAMVLHRAHTMSADYNHFTCRTYKKDSEACTAHYIRECILDEIVLEDLRRVTAEARAHPQEFAEYLNSKQSAEDVYKRQALFPIAGARAANTAEKKTIATIVATTKGKKSNFEPA